VALSLQRQPAVAISRRTLLLTLTVTLAAGLLIFAGYLFHLNRRLGEAIVSAPWRNPIEIVSAVRGADSDPIIRVYGDDWRVTDPLRLRDLPPHVRHAFLAAEDVRYQRHMGVDPIGLARAAWANIRGGRVVQGGSTITQQLIKQKLFSNERSYRRKILEMILALVLSARMSKDDVLEGYLNDVYLGQFGGAPVLGVDEAAQLYFGKVPGALTVDEAAFIASMIRAPNRNESEQEALARRNRVLSTMHEQHWITDNEYLAGIGRPLRLHPGDLPDTPFGHYLSAVRTELAGLSGIDARSGVRIVCEIDPTMQRAAEWLARRGTADVRRQYRWLRSRSDLEIAILSADPSSGGIRALVGSRDFRFDAYDRTRRMHRQPGSALKPFVYTAALASRRFTTTSVLLDEPLTVRLDRRRVWQPQDYDEQFRGPVALRVALEQSLNVPTVRLAQSVGLDRVVHQLRDFGFDGDFQPVPSLPLGVTEVTLRELVSAYSAFPALGERTPLHLVREIRDRRGRAIYRFEGKKEKACDPAVAWLVHDLLRGVVMRGTASRLAEHGLDFVAGKTGTTSDYRDAWFIGYTTDLVSGLWLGSDSGAPIRLSAGEVAVPLWSAYVRQIRTNRASIPPPPGIVLSDVDPMNGGIWEEGCEGPIPEAFLAGTEPRETCNGIPLREQVLARLRGNPEPPVQSGESAQPDDDSDTPTDIVTPSAGRVPEIRDDDDDDEKRLKKRPGKRSQHRVRHRRHHRHREVLTLRSLLRRILG
jgi:penicillin-binding protein 1B